MSVQRTRERLAAGWSFAEAVMGKGWEARYPNVAAWQGSYLLAGSPGRWKIELTVSGPPESSSHRMDCVLHAAEVICAPAADKYQVLDEVIQSWRAEHGDDLIARGREAWTRDPQWKTRYPHLAAWIARGKRHCVRIRIDFPHQTSTAKAWFYHKPSDTETVLYEKAFAHVSEERVLASLDQGIADWMAAGHSELAAE